MDPVLLRPSSCRDRRSLWSKNLDRMREAMEAATAPQWLAALTGRRRSNATTKEEDSIDEQHDYDQVDSEEESLKEVGNFEFSHFYCNDCIKTALNVFFHN